MSVLDVVRELARKNGLEDTEVETLLADDSSPEVDFDQAIPGGAADVLEVFLADGGEAVEDKDGLIWSPMIRSGQFALRPGPRGQKVRKALKIVPGKSKNPLKEIGLGDLTAAFDGDAVDYVTVPTSHENTVLQNTGFIRGMKVVNAPIATGPKKGQKVPTLFGGYDFTEPDVKEKAKRGTIPGRSCGILYNYENTETGDSWPSVVEHVALTSKPWIRGMTPFGRKLSESDDAPVEMTLSDVPPVEPDEIETLLADSDETISWTHEDSPNWARQQINEILDRARAEKRKARPSNSFVEEPTPYYRASDVKPEGDNGGKSLISDGYGDGANYWVASYSIDDGNIALSDFKEWQAVKSVYVSDDRDPPEKKKEPLDEASITPPSKIKLAQDRRKARVRGERVSSTPIHPRGGEKMDPSENGNTLQLSEEARKLIEAAEARAQAAEQKAEDLSEKVTRLTDSDRKSSTKEFLDELRSMGLDEKHGQTGLLNEIEKVCQADDGEPAVVSESFSDDGKSEVSLTVTGALRRIFGALKRGEDGKVALAEQLEQPSDDSTKASEDPDGSDGKPPKDEVKQDPYSVEGAAERAASLAEDNEELAALAPSAVKKNTEGGE